MLTWNWSGPASTKTIRAAGLHYNAPNGSEGRRRHRNTNLDSWPHNACLNIILVE